MMAESKAKPRGASRAGSKSAPKAGARSKAVAGADAQRAAGTEASRLIDQRIRSLGDWRGQALARMRALILEADPDMIEQWKWMGTPVWSHAGNVCTGESYKQVVKLTFARGASLDDPGGLFNSSLEGNTRRAINIREGEAVDAQAFKALIQAAVAENLRSSAARSKSIRKSPPKPGAKADAKAGPGAKGAKPTKSRRGEDV